MILLRMRWLAALLAIIALQVFAQTPAPAKPTKLARLALVIGHAAYKDDKLLNPVNDAHDMAALLKQAGFEVVYRENASLREMHLALRDFGDRLGRETLGLLEPPSPRRLAVGRASKRPERSALRSRAVSRRRTEWKRASDPSVPRSGRAQ